MIASLRGRLVAVDGAAAVVDVGGVGYLVQCPVRTLAALPPAGEEVMLLIDMQVRGARIVLSGFQEPAERAWFRLLQNVQGMGTRLALAVLGVLTPEALAQAISAGDAAMLKRAPGVGQRLAQRLVSELKDKAGSLPLPQRADGTVAAAAARPAGDAVSALVNLGYRPNEAAAAVDAALRRLGPEAELSSLISAGLQELAR